MIYFSGNLPKYPTFSSEDNPTLTDLKSSVEYIRELHHYIINLNTAISQITAKMIMLENRIFQLEDDQRKEEMHMRNLSSLAESLQIDKVLVDEWKDFLLLMRLRGIS